MQLCLSNDRAEHQSSILTILVLIQEDDTVLILLSTGLSNTLGCGHLVINFHSEKIMMEFREFMFPYAIPYHVLDKVLVVAGTEEHEILSRLVITTRIVVITTLMDDVHFQIDLWRKIEKLKKNLSKINLKPTRDQGILASDRTMLQRKPREDLSGLEVTAVRKYLKVFSFNSLPFLAYI